MQNLYIHVRRCFTTALHIFIPVNRFVDRSILLDTTHKTVLYLYYTYKYLYLFHLIIAINFSYFSICVRTYVVHKMSNSNIRNML